MHHKEQFARDIASRLHEHLTDEWLYSWSCDAIVAAVVAMPPNKIEHARNIANTIMKANVLTHWDRPGTLGYRQMVGDIAEQVVPLVSDYSTFLHNQLELRPIMALPRSKPRPAKAMPITSEQHLAMENYFENVRLAAILQTRVFPDNVIDMLAYRARQMAWQGA